MNSVIKGIAGKNTANSLVHKQWTVTWILEYEMTRSEWSFRKNNLLVATGGNKLGRN